MRPDARREGNDQDGAATVLVVALVGVLAVVALAASLLGVATVARHRAEAAADLAALAAADRLAVGLEPCAVAQGVARANGSRLVDCRVEGTTVRVRARVAAGRLSALAEARAGPPPAGPPPAAGRPGRPARP